MPDQPEPIPFTLYPINPTQLTPRYEIRQLTLEHVPWAQAIASHSNIFYNPFISVTYPTDQVARCYDLYSKIGYLISHQILSGMSFGIFDLNYVYKNPESEKVGGKLWWDEKKVENMDKEKLLEQMDFALVSIVLSFDEWCPVDKEKLVPIQEVLPLSVIENRVIEERDKRDEKDWKATGFKQVLMRNSTSTRVDYEGQGLMKMLSQWLMKQASLEGYRAIEIKAAHYAVKHVWLHPPEPFKAEVIAVFDPGAYREKNEKGEEFNPFGKATQLVTKIHVTLQK